ncbi:v-type proton ATPase subunit C [Trichonephila clavipes]|nr:v-type proton ATPase subunit C [Trichonephila clavipes]
MPEFWVISAPGPQALEKLNAVTKPNNLSVNYKFHIPDLKVGTLDTLVGLTDDLAKLDTYVEGIIRKIVSYMEEVLEDQKEMLSENLHVNNAKKEDLRRIASELELCVSDKLTVLDFMDLIKNCDLYKNDPDSVHELANLIIEERKYDESQQLELEKIREKSKLDLEIARIQANDKGNNTEVNCNDCSSLDSLIKSIRTLK